MVRGDMAKDLVGTMLRLGRMGYTRMEIIIVTKEFSGGIAIFFLTIFGSLNK
jgi:hypothetical protein